MNSTKALLFLSSCFVFIGFSCCVHDKSEKNSNPPEVPAASIVAPQIYNIEIPQANQTFKSGESIFVQIQNNGSQNIADSIAFFMDGKPAGFITGSDSGISIETKAISPGIKRLKMEVFFPDGKTESKSIPLRFLSDIKPKQFGYRILGAFPHDIKSYTQGFEYHDGYFYEGTGQYRESSLQKVLPGTGDKIKYRNNSSDIFGEGITLLNRKIYQISYRSQIGFIYDSESFELLQKFGYQNVEGWGLCNDGKEIIMSDGTNVLYFRDPEYFSVNRKIEVFDDVSEVDSLNELEFINGIIYANRYMTNEIVLIDPSTGKVAGKADMRGLLSAKDRHERIDVLNGIAWDKEGQRLFVTGKYWPKVFSIELFEK
jgi:glutamine cyclotransferase